MKRTSNKCTCWKYDNFISDGWPFFCFCSKDWWKMCDLMASLCVSVRSLKGWSWLVVLALCFWGVDASSVFISSYSYISIFLTVLSGSAVHVMSVYGSVCVFVRRELVCRVSLNTQSFHKTDPSRAVGGPNTDLLRWAKESVMWKFMACSPMCVCSCVYKHVQTYSTVPFCMIKQYITHSLSLWDVLNLLCLRLAKMMFLFMSLH